MCFVGVGQRSKGEASLTRAQMTQKQLTVEKCNLIMGDDSQNHIPSVLNTRQPSMLYIL